ncbi:hypothetical protein L6164_012830 [Bauhinia variegata]|uniref:Uncharacterized protein n=1 Tax=Bauhinia variegata TaxID=167791 RepID=A0ACB9PAA5_BAUVA|nr:hypothetical protein L6164_012830 [Bauhinia variegata]
MPNEKTSKLRKEIEDRLIAAAASGKDLEETGGEDDGLLDLSDDDFFLSGSSSDEAGAGDEYKSTRLLVTSGKAVSGMSNDEKNQRQISARALMPPPRSSNKHIRISRTGYHQYDIVTQSTTMENWMASSNSFQILTVSP